MPKLGESITEGTILSWSVKVGDNVQEDDVLFEVSTAKVSAEIPSPIAGQVHDIFFAEGDTVAVGTVVATILPEDEEGENEETTGGETEATTAPAATPETSQGGHDTKPSSSAPASEPASGAEETDASAVASEATIASRPAATNAGPATDSSSQTPAADSGAGKKAPIAANRWYSPVVLQLAKEAGISNEELDRIPGTGFEGRLSKKDMQNYIRQKQSGETASTASGTPTDTEAPSSASVLDSPATQPTGQKADNGTQVKTSSTTTSSAASASVTSPQSAATATGSTSPASPSSASPTAPIPSAGQPASPKAAPASPLSPGDTRVEMDRIRRMIADHMVRSKQVSPHVTSVIEIDVTRLARWRARTKEEFFRREGIKLTYMPAIAEATARALTEYPQLNASVDGYSIILKKHINLGIAVSLDDGNLIVPVIPDADKLNLSGLASAIDGLAAKARHNKLSPADIQGGTFTITNFGTFKSLFGTPIINQPEVAILAVGYIQKKPVVVETPEGDTLAIRYTMYLSLSYDHRVIDGALGGSFLRRIGDLLENWNA